ncbi:MAG: haloacid dehalogenase type II [Burkholderiales bacterium]
MKRRLKPVKALTFDVFGTVVDWRGSIMREAAALAAKKKWSLDPAAFADAWRAGYQPAMHRVRTGELPWTRIDDLHRMILDALIPQFGLEGLSEVERVHLNLVWHRLKPWPDAVRGLRRLKKRLTICTLSNGNIALLTNMAKAGGLPWDCVLSAEIFAHYKPDPETYLGAAKILGLEPREVMMVAAHKNDLDAAAKCGLATGFVTRPNEFGMAKQPDLKFERRFDANATDFLDLADQFGL